MTDPAAQFEAMVEAIVDKRLAELGLAANGNEKLLTVDEAADLVRVKPATIRDWIADGRLPEAGRAGRRIRVRAGDVLEVVAGGRDLHALRTNGDGSPAHPLYLPASLMPMPWSPP